MGRRRTRKLCERSKGVRLGIGPQLSSVPPSWVSFGYRRELQKLGLSDESVHDRDGSDFEFVNPINL